MGAFGIKGGGVSDTTPPTVTIASTETSPSPLIVIPMTFTLSEVATDFAVGDITVGAGGSIGNFAGSGKNYTADLTVTTPLATITVDVAANAFHDGAGNGNTAATQFSMTSSLAVWDTFTGTDGTLLTAHTPDFAANAWATAGISARIMSNKATITAANNPYRNSIDTTIADCIITATIVTGQTDDAVNEYNAILARVTDPNNEWEILISKNTTNKFCIQERTASTSTVRAIAADFVYASNTTYNLTVTLKGNDITASCTGGYTGTLTYSSAVRNTVTKHGLSFYDGATVTNAPSIDNFKVVANP